MRRGKIIVIVLVLVIAAVLTTCHFGSTDKADESPPPVETALAAPTPTPTASPEPEPEPEPTERPIINQYVADEIAKYPDIIGHLVLPDTRVDYMVVRGEDNDFYLNHTPYGVEEYAGSIFMDYTCEPDFSNITTVIYGHNMKDGSMFGDLMKYGDHSFFDEHPEGYLYLPRDNITIEFFASLMVDHEDEMIYRRTYREEHLEYIRENARNYREIELAEDDHFIVLSTCAYEFLNARMVIIGRINYETDLDGMQ